MTISPGRLLKLYEGNPREYETNLRALLGYSEDAAGFRCIREPEFRPRQLSFLDVGEAFVGRDGLRAVSGRPFGTRGGHALTAPPAGWTFEEVGGGALGPSQFQGLNAWLATVDGLLGAELLEKYEPAVQTARELVTWRMDIRIQEAKLLRYTTPTAPNEDLMPSQEFPSGDLGGDWVRANRMRKQGEALSISWEAAHFDQTDTLLDAADDLAYRFALVINKRIESALWGVENTHNRLGTISDTYKTSGSYINKITNPLTKTEAALDVAEQQLKQQKDPVTLLPIGVRPGERTLVVTPYKEMTAYYLANPAGNLNIGSFNDAERRDVRPFHKLIRVPDASQFAVDLMVARLGITAAQARERWVYGDTKRAFQYRSAKDVTTYRYTIADVATLARRDVIMELDISEMGAVTVIEPRLVVLNINDSPTLFMEGRQTADATHLLPGTTAGDRPALPWDSEREWGRESKEQQGSHPPGKGR